ncbi:unnamed protein product [Effrenium voratum]|uniref:Fe2OG dioxygenase domain-containing protein n=1 Tax=Effrenium voratum TaxID=2562239 RepID=A0AA36IED0_9DINO|nr:unnamed protein product [Effrenium voratum]
MAPADFVVEALRGEHLEAAARFLGAFAGPARWEDRLRGVAAAVARGEGGEVCGVALLDPEMGWEVHCGIPGLGSRLVAAASASAAGAAFAAASASEAFWARGFQAFPGLLAQAPLIREKMDLMMRGASGATSDWNAVNEGAAFVSAVDERGEVIPGRILKVQAAACASSAVLELFASPQVVERVRQLYEVLGQEAPKHVDVFGTKFFPMWPGGVSVHWHQDGHFFGTASPRIISCGIYLEDTDEENGCLQVVPGSHTRSFEHVKGEGLHAQGEWARPDDSDEILDVVVPAGSVVLFNSRLLHSARRNQHETRTRYSLHLGRFFAAHII